jgi:hypothetical protein
VLRTNARNAARTHDRYAWSDDVGSDPIDPAVRDPKGLCATRANVAQTERGCGWRASSQITLMIKEFAISHCAFPQ